MEPIFNFRETQSKLNYEFAEYLRNKNVAIVGRSCIHDLEQGELIDSHDVVVRIHRPVPYLLSESVPNDNTVALYNDPVHNGQFVPERFHPIVGKRVDVLYHRVRTDDREYMRKWLAAFRYSGGKFVCNDCTSSQDAFSDAYAQRYMPVRYVTWELKSLVTMQLNKKPDGGFICIADILSHHVNNVYITGFPCYFDEVFFPELPHAKSARREKELQWLFHLAKHERITCDPRMEELFRRFCE